jgi:hypothetical protein
MTRTICCSALLFVAACGEQDLTSTIANRDPDLTGRYQSGLGIVITDSVLYASGWGGGLGYGVILNTYCPAEWVLSQTKRREYAVTIHLSADLCRDSYGHIADYVTLPPTFTGILRIDRVHWSSLDSESLGAITIGGGTAQAFHDLTGCSPARLDGGWSLSFQAYTRRDYTFDNGWAFFWPHVPSTLQGQGPFRIRCHEIDGLFMNWGFNFLRATHRDLVGIRARWLPNQRLLLPRPSARRPARAIF